MIKFMGKFEFVSHTADVRMKILGGTLEDLFRAGVLGLAEFLKQGFCGNKSEKREKVFLSVSSPDKTALLIDFLSEILTTSHTRRAVFYGVEFEELTETKIEAIIFGAGVEKFNDDVKAITYHEADVKKNKKGEWETVVVFDI